MTAADVLESDPVYQRGREFVARIAPSPDVLTQRVGFVLLSPMGLESGRAPVAIRWLSANGFVPHFMRTLRLTREIVRVLWEPQSYGVDPTRDQIFGDVMTWREALFIGISTPTGGDASCAAALRARKGPSDPRKGERKQLRRTLGAANIFNNLVHSPDGPSEVVRESRALLDDEGLAEFWRGAPLASTESRLPPSALRPVTILLPALSLRRSLLAKLDRLEPVLLAALRADADRQIAWLATCDPLRSTETWQGFQTIFGSNASVELSAPRSPRVAAAFNELGKALCGKPFDLDALLLGGGIPLEPREQVILSTEWLSRRYESG
jgi:hypothetical protein